nr:MAG TPA: hypothetical protein [Caudoviricetes sp.]
MPFFIKLLFEVFLVLFKLTSINSRSKQARKLSFLRTVCISLHQHCLPVSWSKIIYDRISFIKSFCYLLHNGKRFFSSLLIGVLYHLECLTNNWTVLSRIIKE